MDTSFILADREGAADFVLDPDACEGIRRIADKVREDVRKVTGRLPKLAEETGPGFQVLAGILEESRMLKELEEEAGDYFQKIRGKRECYTFLVLHAKEGEKPKLVIAGSDKRGCIYGLFHISELMGVSPWVTFGDAVPKKRQSVVFTRKDNRISREPSVKYRGFFLNDEWPALGNWTFEKFGGFTWQMYDMIFETLLRLKGNYLWPAMWTSSFSLDGPGEENARLADAYGIVMSNSHHEPCLRHSEEWDMVKGEDSPYGKDWNYLTNKEGLLEYWKDGLRQRGKYENIITIGMRGERDSLLLEENAGLEKNIGLLKDVITQQRRLIREYVEKDRKEAPQLFVIYKEVEDYFYGTQGKQDGLKDWEGLEGVTLMVCEDNYGNLRRMPEKEVRDRKGGWGIYYHFDYHGSPVSYEWVNSSYLPKIWDQMTAAYEFGVRDIWVVNVGDLKFQEYPLSFFMDLAYDYQTWGADNKKAPDQYLKYWVEREFGGWLEGKEKALLEEVMAGYTKINHNRKPEAMGPQVYHPVHFGETEKLLGDIQNLEEKLDFLKEMMPGERLASYWELVYYPARGSFNVQKMNLYGGLNHYFARMRALSANTYGKKMKECIAIDRSLTKAFHSLLEGKWNHMGDSRHVGFCHWNDEESGYPLEMVVEPSDAQELAVYVQGESTWTCGGDWTGKNLFMKQFLEAGVDRAAFVLENRSREPVEFQIESSVPWISFSETRGKVQEKKEILVSVDKTKSREKKGLFYVKYGARKIQIQVEWDYAQIPDCPVGTFLEKDGYVSIDAEHYARKQDTAKGSFQILDGYGKTLSGLKVFPCSQVFQGQDRPSLLYRVYVHQPGTYELELYCAPVNPLSQRWEIRCSVRVNDQEEMPVSLLPKDFHGGDPGCGPWCEMVLDQIVRKKVEIRLQAGVNEIWILGETPGFLLEKLTAVREGKELPNSYLGPEETYRNTEKEMSH